MANNSHAYLWQMRGSAQQQGLVLFRAGNDALPFDVDYQPKPAWHAIQRAVGREASPAPAAPGAPTVSAAGGVATFPDVSLAKAGTGYTLTASATGLASGTSVAAESSAIGMRRG